MVRFVNIRKLKNRVLLEDHLFAHSIRFLKSVQASYSEYRKKGGIPLAKLLAKSKRDLSKFQR